MKAPEITRARSWDVYSVHALCVKYGFYTFGCNAEFDAMLEYVRTHEPTDEAMCRAAIDIFQSSESGITTLENLLYLLEKEAVVTTFRIGEAAECA